MITPDKFGCEFEFILNTAESEKELLSELQKIFGEDNVKHSSTTNIITTDKEWNFIHFKCESSLDSELGREITAPIGSLNELINFINTISTLIPKYSYTNETCGFHIHMSCKSEEHEILYGLFVLIAESKELLNKWGKRNKFALNVADIFNALTIEDAITFKEHKGRVWNLLKRGPTWVEIRTMGGTSYETKVQNILSELNIFVKVYEECFNSMNKSKYLDLVEKHTKNIESTDQKQIEIFLTNFPEIVEFIDPTKMLIENHPFWQ